MTSLIMLRALGNSIGSCTTGGDIVASFGALSAASFPGRLDFSRGLLSRDLLFVQMIRALSMLLTLFFIHVSAASSAAFLLQMIL